MAVDRMGVTCNRNRCHLPDRDEEMINWKFWGRTVPEKFPVHIKQYTEEAEFVAAATSLSGLEFLLEELWCEDPDALFLIVEC